MVNNHPPIATPFNNFCPKTLSNQARDKNGCSKDSSAPTYREHRGDEEIPIFFKKSLVARYLCNNLY